MTIEELYRIIEDRKKNMPKNSYVASLFSNGKDRIIQKVGEEATEVVIAAKNKDRQEVISETADLLFHLLVLLSLRGIEPFEIFDEFERRKK